MKRTPQQTCLAVFMTLGAAVAAQAQESAQVNATATIQVLEPGLAITGDRALSFGEVNKPDGSTADRFCLYEVRGDTDTPIALEASTSDAFRQLVTPATPSPSGCGWGALGTPNIERGKFTIDCDPSSTVSLSASWVDGGVTGVAFSDMDNGPVHLASYRNDNFSGSPTGVSFSNEPLSAVCPTDLGTITLAVGGRLTINDTAFEASDVTVGSVLVEASYE